MIKVSESRNKIRVVWWWHCRPLHSNKVLLQSEKIIQRRERKKNDRERRCNWNEVENRIRNHLIICSGWTFTMRYKAEKLKKDKADHHFRPLLNLLILLIEVIFRVDIVNGTTHTHKHSLNSTWQPIQLKQISRVILLFLYAICNVPI